MVLLDALVELLSDELLALLLDVDPEADGGGPGGGGGIIPLLSDDEDVLSVCDIIDMNWLARLERSDVSLLDDDDELDEVELVLVESVGGGPGGGGGKLMSESDDDELSDDDPALNCARKPARAALAWAVLDPLASMVELLDVDELSDDVDVVDESELLTLCVSACFSNLSRALVFVELETDNDMPATPLPFRQSLALPGH